MMRSVEYIRCKICNKQVDVYFAHGAVQVFACIYCYKPLSKVGKLFHRIGIWWRGRKGLGFTLGVMCGILSIPVGVFIAVWMT